MTHGERHSGRFGELFARLGKGPVEPVVQPAMPSDVARAVRGEDSAAGGVASEIWMEEMSESELEQFNERAAIREYCAGVSREEAERLSFNELVFK